MSSPQPKLQDSRPLFVLGVPRSGTTHLHQVLNSHPDVFLTDELRVVAWLFREAHKIDGGFAKHGDPYPFLMGSDFANYLRRQAPAIIRPFFHELAARAGREQIVYWGDKYPHYHDVLAEMTLSFPRARYVMIHRDPRDVVCSVMRGHKWDVAYSTEYVFRIWTEYLRKIESLEQTGRLPDLALLHVSFQDLFEKPVDTAKGIFARLGLELPEQVRAEIERLAMIQSHSMRLREQKAIGFVPTESVGRFRRELTDEQVFDITQRTKALCESLKSPERIGVRELLAVGEL